jgi:hydrogenase/urease accessory protein HupE
MPTGSCNATPLLGSLGGMVAFAAKPPLWIAAVLVGALAVFHSPAHGAELLVGADAVGAAIVLALVAEGAVYLRGHALLIAGQVAGSWIAAIGIMVPSLRIVTRMTIG